jgi:hypothetical protein
LNYKLGDGIENNSANLVINFGFKGLLVDGASINIQNANKYYHELLEKKYISDIPIIVGNNFNNN